MSENIREDSAVTGPEQPAETQSFAQEQMSDVAGWGPESADPQRDRPASDEEPGVPDIGGKVGDAG